MSRCARWLGSLAVVTIAAAGAPCAHADESKGDDSKGKDKSKSVVDLVEMLERLTDDVRASTERPDDPGHADKLHEAWKLHVSRKASRMMRRPRNLAKDHLWIFPEGATRAAWLKPSQWSGAVRALAGLYVELGTAEERYRRVNVTGTAAHKAWDRNNPPPESEGLTPAGLEASRVRALIRQCIAAGEFVPDYLTRELERLVALEAIEIREREKRYEQYERDRQAAHAAIDDDVKRTKAALRAQRDGFRAHMQRTRELCAEMQKREEQRLREALAALPADDPVHAAARKHLTDMERGRAKALRFARSPVSKWGTLVRQGWMVPRARLDAAVRAAQRRLAEPSAPAPGK